MSAPVVPAEELADMVARRVVDLIKSDDLVRDESLPESVRALILGHETNRRILGWGHAETVEHVRATDPHGLRFPHGPACGRLGEWDLAAEREASYGVVSPPGSALACGHLRMPARRVT